VKQHRELALDADEIKARNVTGLKLHQKIDVAARAEVITQNGSKEREPFDVMPAAQFRDSRGVNRYVRTHRYRSIIREQGIVVEAVELKIGEQRVNRAS
jgi:hypothetical protein